MVGLQPMSNRGKGIHVLKEVPKKPSSVTLTIIQAMALFALFALIVSLMSGNFTFHGTLHQPYSDGFNCQTHTAVCERRMKDFGQSVQHMELFDKLQLQVHLEKCSFIRACLQSVQRCNYARTINTMRKQDIVKECCIIIGESDMEYDMFQQFGDEGLKSFLQFIDSGKNLTDCKWEALV